MTHNAGNSDGGDANQDPNPPKPPVVDPAQGSILKILKQEAGVESRTTRSRMKLNAASVRDNSSRKSRGIRFFARPRVRCGVYFVFDAPDPQIGFRALYTPMHSETPSTRGR